MSFKIFFLSVAIVFIKQTIIKKNELLCSANIVNFD